MYRKNYFPEIWDIWKNEGDGCTEITLFEYHHSEQGTFYSLDVPGQEGEKEFLKLSFPTKKIFVFFCSFDVPQSLENTYKFWSKGIKVWKPIVVFNKYDLVNPRYFDKSGSDDDLSISEDGDYTEGESICKDFLPKDVALMKKKLGAVDKDIFSTCSLKMDSTI